MEDLKIKTVLGIVPRKKPHELTKIIRGASAKLDYVLSDKWYTFDTLEQVTYTFKQKRRIIWFNMFIYLKKTEDTTVDIYKTYYENVRQISPDSLQCLGDLVTEPVENPKEANYYEVVEITDGENNLCYLLDSHFYYTVDGENEYISFIFTPEETASFYPTQPGANVGFEIALRFNTDNRVDLTNKDSVVIDPQSPLIVIDSLYSQINADGETCNDDTGMVVSTDRNVW